MRLSHTRLFPFIIIKNQIFWVWILKYWKSTCKLSQYAICVLGFLEKNVTVFIFVILGYFHSVKYKWCEQMDFGKRILKNMTFKKQSDGFGAVINLRLWLSSRQKQGGMCKCCWSHVPLPQMAKKSHIIYVTSSSQSHRTQTTSLVFHHWSQPLSRDLMLSKPSQEPWHSMALRYFPAQCIRRGLAADLVSPTPKLY